MRTKPKPPAKFRARYPWDEWFTRSGAVPIVLRRGRDFFDCLPSSLAVMARVEMTERNILRTIRVTEGAVEIGPKSDWRGRKRAPAA